MNRRILAALSVGFCLASGTAFAAEWTIDPETSILTFQGTQTGEPFNGGFDSFTAAITLDPADLTGARIELRVDIASFNSRSSDRDGLALGVDWFAVDMFPEAVFLSEAVTSEGGNAYVAEGTLTIRDVSMPLVLPFTLDIDDAARATAEGALVLDRFAFGLGQRDFADPGLVGAEVGVSFHVEAVQ